MVLLKSKDYHNSFLTHAQLIVENLLAIALCIHSFLTHYTVGIKRISTINPAITENMECSIIEVHSSHRFKSGCVPQSWHITMLCFEHIG